MSRFGKIAIAAIAVFAIAVFAIPNLLSTDVVKQRIEDQLSQLTGRQVSLEGDSRISLRPYLGVSYNKVVVTDSRDAPGAPLVTVEQFKARLGLFAALFGDAKITEIELIRPHFHLHIGSNGARNWLSDRGQIGAWIKGEESSGTLNLGKLRIEDGKAELRDENSDKTVGITAINGDLNWPDIHSGINIDASLVWRGEIAKLSASVSKPLDYIRDGATELSLRLAANPVSISYDGKIESQSNQSEGELTIQSASPKRLTDWINWQLPVAELLGTASISGSVSTRGYELEFPEAEVVLGEHTGKGRVQLTIEEDRTIVADGTLAFDSISFPPLTEILASPANTEQSGDALALPLFHGLAVDVRLSANTATSGPVTVNDLAASIIVRDNEISFDIGQAAAAGGMVAGSINLRAPGDQLAFSGNLSLSDVELQQLTSVYEDSGFSLTGKGNVEIKLKSTATDANGLLLRLNGEGNLQGHDGVLQGLDLPGLLASTTAGSNNVTRVSDATTDYSAFKLGFFIANGTAFLRDSSMASDVISVSLKGRIDLVAGALALRGNIHQLDDGTLQADGVPFFVGGTAVSPLFVPLPTVDQRQAPPPDTQKPAPSQ
ncbi:MAG: AsmA family protein [Rhizobiaceae bacterium]